MNKRLLIMSDLHIDTNANILFLKKKELKKAYIDYIVSKQDKFDVLLITGDISDNMMYSLTLLRDLQEQIPTKVIKFVPGNHDISNCKMIDKTIHSDSIYSIYLNSPFSLSKPFLLSDDYVIVGGLGWYDYGFVDNYLKEINEKEREETLIELKKTKWRDGRQVDFKLSDKEVAFLENKRYESLFKEFKDKKIILMNHFVPFYRYLIWNKIDDEWCRKNAFMGSAALEDLIEKNPQIKYVLFGHTHERHGVKIIGNRKEICSPLGYVGEWDIEDNRESQFNEDNDIRVFLDEEKINMFVRECEKSSVFIVIK